MHFFMALSLLGFRLFENERRSRRLRGILNLNNRAVQHENVILRIFFHIVTEKRQHHEISNSFLRRGCLGRCATLSRHAGNGRIPR